jgi:hypothetical protein
MAYVYWIRTKDILSITDGYIGVTGTGKTKKTIEGRLQEHIKSRRFIAYASKKELMIESIFEGTDEECFAKEKELRPNERMGWNISPGGEGGYRGNHWSNRHEMHWRNKITDSYKKNLAAGKISIWNKGKKYTPEQYFIIIEPKKLLPSEYVLKNIITNEQFIVYGYDGISELVNIPTRDKIATLVRGQTIEGCPFVLVSKRRRTVGSEKHK